MILLILQREKEERESGSLRISGTIKLRESVVARAETWRESLEKSNVVTAATIWDMNKQRREKLQQLSLIYSISDCSGIGVCTYQPPKNFWIES